MHLYLALAFAFSMAIATFAIQNSALVTIRFLIWELPSIPQVVVILLSALVGIIVAFLFGMIRQYKVKKQLLDIKAYAQMLEQELSKMKVSSHKANSNDK